MDAMPSLLDELRACLNHLYDPLFKVSPHLAACLGLGPYPTVEEARSAITAAIERLRPTPETPPHARAWRLYEILHLRYLDHLTQEQTAQKLAITVRHLAREQADAIELLAQSLFSDREHPLEREPGSQREPTQEERNAINPRNQVRAEVAALEAHAPAPVANVRHTAQGVIHLLKDWAARQNVHLILAPGEETYTRVHPGVLKELLLSLVAHLVRALEEGTVEIHITAAKGRVTVLMRQTPAISALPEEDWFGWELLQTQHCSLHSVDSENAFEINLVMPEARSATVFVVDDNQDLVHYYQRCTAGTPYRIIHIPRGREIFPALERQRPDAIVLDLMLPDVDGWEILGQLHEHPLSRTVPVIVCSVVREAELALALGATVFLAKPVKRQQFLEALAQVINPAAGAEQTAHENPEAVS